MANSHKSKLNSKPDDDRRRCKKHPKHRQSPGVCSLCLIEKLSHISAASVSRKTSKSLSSSSSSSYYSSASSCSSCSSPNLYSFSMDRRKAAPISSSSLNSIFKKSKSVAFAPRFGRRREEDNGKRSNNVGFWLKFFVNRQRRKRTIMEEVV